MEQAKESFAGQLVLPAPVRSLIARLEAAGYEAWAVGGCVRDSLLGQEPHDWDLCTSALPGQLQQVFADLPVLETGLAHGTLTVLLDHVPYEITTYRRDGAYTDHRRPDRVTFVSALEEDLARRDFTINAMAAGPRGLVDRFGGREDLAAGIIRCVGDPERRFAEDALRILRALRFASRLGFTVEEATAKAMLAQRESLRAVSAERVWTELCGLLEGPAAARVLQRFTPVLEAVIPELGPCVGFEQHHPSHDKDVWGHTLEALSYAPADLSVRWALLLHDLAKPRCFTLDEAGVGHFYGHAGQGGELAAAIFDRLRADHKRRDEVVFLVTYHDAQLSLTKKGVRSWLRRAGEPTLRRLLTVKRCDLAAHRPLPAIEAARAQTDAFEALLDRVLAEPPLLGPRDLAISGRELLALGLAPGPEVGRLLESLLALVEEEQLPNKEAALLAEARRRLGLPEE